MIRTPFVALLCAVAALALLACGGDDEDEPGVTPSRTSAAATASPTVEPAIVVEAPAPDDLVQVPFEASGTANVFEGALTVRVLSGGTLLCERHVQATSGSGTRGTWSAPLAFVPPGATPATAVGSGAAPVTLRALTFSARDGAPENITDVSLRLSSDLPPIYIESPGCAQTVAAGSLLTVRGMAQVFEAVLFVDIRDASNAALLTQRVMAASGTELSPWSTAFDLSMLPGGGLYDVVAYDKSARDGAIENEFTVQISVGP